MGLRLNAPYAIAYSMGLSDGKKYPEWTEQDRAKGAYFSATALMAGGSANRGANRYFKELAHVYMVAAEEGQTGTLITEDEWCSRYHHPREIHQIMQKGK